MKVRELILRLQSLNPELPVVMPSERFDFCEVDGAYVDLLATSKRGGLELADERDADRIEVVRLFGPDSGD
jgi:hypothetical protein